MTPATPLKPSSWLIELTRPRPAKWQWNRALRIGICIGLPITLGIGIGGATAVAFGVWMSICSLMLATGESSASYRSRFKVIAISASLGALGCLVGYIDFLPWTAIVLIMTVLAFAAGIICSYGAAYSQGMLQFLVLAAVAVGHPQIAPFWQAGALYLLGAVFYALALGVEALLMPDAPRRQLKATLIHTLAELAQKRAEAIAAATDTGTTTRTDTSIDTGTYTGTTTGTGSEQHPLRPDNNTAGTNNSTAGQNADTIESVRRAVTAQISALYADTLERSSHRGGRTSDTDALWATLQCADAVFAAILSATSHTALGAAAQQLKAIAQSIQAGKKHPPASSARTSKTPQAQGALATAVHALSAAQLWSHSPFSPIVMSAPHTAATTRRPLLGILRDKLSPGRQVQRFSAALALCVGLSYAAHWFDHDTRWYWVPLSVAIIMKPDFGSIFARSLLRDIGTIGGAVIATVLLLLLSKGMVLAAAIGLLALLMPWAAQRSSILLTAVITPMILVLIDFTVPTEMNINYSVQRIISTVIAGGIVLAFGYFIWPRTHARELAEAFRKANRMIADYLLATFALRDGDAPAEPPVPIAKKRRLAYAGLMDMRTQLQKTISEPPPAGTEATAWLPIVASAERICDQITAYSVHSSDATGTVAAPQHPDTLARQIHALAEEIAAVPESISTATADTSAPLLSPQTNAGDTAEQELTRGIAEELNFIRKAIGQTAPQPLQSALSA